MLARTACEWNVTQADITQSIHQCFQAWVAARGIATDQASDLGKTITKVQSFLEVHGPSRFLKYREGRAEDRVVHNQAGILEVSKIEQRYLINTTTFREEICTGNHTEVAKALFQLGYLEHDKGEWVVKRHDARYYSISADFLRYQGGNAA